MIIPLFKSNWIVFVLTAVSSSRSGWRSTEVIPRVRPGSSSKSQSSTTLNGKYPISESLSVRNS
jgi:hypothetical protein